jgi:hypothetical protein
VVEDACEGEPIFLSTSNTFNISPQLKSGFFRQRLKILGPIECGAQIYANPATYSWPWLLTAVVWPPFWINSLDTTLIAEPLLLNVRGLQFSQKKITLDSPRCVPAFYASPNVIPERKSFQTTPSFHPWCSRLISKIRYFTALV